MLPITIYKVKYNNKKDYEKKYYSKSEYLFAFESYCEGDTLKELAENMSKIPIEHTQGVFEISYKKLWDTQVSSNGSLRKAKNLNLTERLLFEYYLIKNFRDK